MKVITGPINCTLCGVQWWNAVVVEAVPDGKETQYVCGMCLNNLSEQELITVKTSKSEISQTMTRMKHA